MNDDTISRQAAIDAVHEEFDDCLVWDESGKRTADEFEIIINRLPSAQATHEERAETHACDCISRQAAIDAIAKMMPQSLTPDGSHPADKEIFIAQEAFADCIKTIEILPSAQPSQDKYEYHYDHTDCIWYRPEARNRCPVTCAQYRDGWNDAMNYIFRDGEGYRPFRRDIKYEG